MTRQVQNVFIVSAIRTPVGKAKGVFQYKRPDDLLSDVLAQTMVKLKTLSAEKIEDVIIGCAMPEAEQGMNVARIATLLAGFPKSIPAMTVNRFCSSGLQAISLASERIAVGEADFILAGGVESMSLVPMGGYHYSANPRYFEDNENLSIAFGMGLTAEIVAKQWGITREAQDIFAYESHQKAVKAIENKEMQDEIIPIKVITGSPDFQTQQTIQKIQEVVIDQGPRRDTSLEILAKLKPVFSVNGSITAGNTSQMSDGAAVVALVSERFLNEYQLTPLAVLKGYTVAGVAPELMGIGPVAAIPQVLKKTGIALRDIEWIELNEAFAAQSLAVIKELDLPREKVNPLGGAIALGHPLGATGAILATKLIHGLHRRKLKYGMVTMCIGTGMGAAGIFERC